MVLLPLVIVPVSQVDAEIMLSLNSSGLVPDDVGYLFRKICDVPGDTPGKIFSIVAPAGMRPGMPGQVTISPRTRFAASWAETVTMGEPEVVVPDADL
jgi:hypothetical protein